MTELESSVTLSLRSTPTFLIVASLHPYYTYDCIVSAYTVASGPYTEVVTVRTPEDGNVNSFSITIMYHKRLLSHVLFSAHVTVPSGYPQNLEAIAITSRSANITWDPPISEEQNGLIIGYTINMTVSQTGDNFQLLSTTTTLLVDTLVPYTTHVFIISASTSIGAGPFSTVLVLETPQDGKLACMIENHNATNTESSIGCRLLYLL